MEHSTGIFAVLFLFVQISHSFADNAVSTSGSPSSGTDQMGIDFNVAHFCTFFSNASYACKTDCLDGSSTFTRSFPEKADLKYTDMNCSTDEPTNGAVWNRGQGILKNMFVDRTIKPSYIVATCSFYVSGWYECQGVADCSTGQVGFLTCAGSAPWRGFYGGTVEGGFTGNITAEAMNAPPAHPHPGRPGPGDMKPPPATSSSSAGSEKKVVTSCEKFFDTDSTCFSVTKSCGTVAGKRGCTSKHVAITPRNHELYRIFDSVVSTLDEGSMAKAADIVAQCYFYDNREYMCGFPFPADFRQSPSFNLRAATGTFYRASY